MERSETPSKKRTTNMGITQLLTPEEPLQESFTKTAPVVSAALQTASPPASPEFRSFDTNTFAQSDAPLFSEPTQQEANTQTPLFESGGNRTPSPDRHSSPATESIATSAEVPQATSPATNDEEVTESTTPALTPESLRASGVQPVGVNQLFMYYGFDYFRYIQAQNRDMFRRRREHRERLEAQRTLPEPRPSQRPHAPRDTHLQATLARLSGPLENARTSTPAIAQTQSRPSTSSRPTSSRPTSSASRRVSDTTNARLARTATPSRITKSEPTKRQRRQASTPDTGGPTQPKARTRATPSKKLDGIPDAEWHKIQDFCPKPLDMPNARPLVATWNNGGRLDLKFDPDRDELSEEELEVASTLRLKCNQYLINKRRIFKARVEHLREGKDFNKTSAQGCTPIDVNKASKLWEAFSNAGWFDEQHFKKFLTSQL